MSRSRIVQSLIHCERANVEAKIIEFDGVPTCATFCDEYSRRERSSDPVIRKARTPLIRHVYGDDFYSELTPIIYACYTHPDRIPITRHRHIEEILATATLETANPGFLASKRGSSEPIPAIPETKMPSMGETFGRDWGHP